MIDDNDDPLDLARRLENEGLVRRSPRLVQCSDATPRSVSE